MNSKISLINILLRGKTSKKIRNFLNIKPSIDLLDYSKKNMSVSDAFFWRVDNNFKTIFRYTNTLELFYGILDEQINIIFFDKNNKFIKNIVLSNKNNNEILIDKNFLNTNEEYGVFYVFHSTSQKLNTIIRNSCYCGYSIGENIPSMVHGNTITASSDMEKINVDYGIGGASFTNKIYTVQNYYNMDKIEIMVVNPLKSKIKIIVNNIYFELKSGSTKLIEINEKLIKLKSKCFLLRPIVFTYKSKYLDVHHG